MGYALAPSLVTARAEVNAGWPGRDKTSDGWIGDTAHQQTGSDHNVGARNLVHALDIDEDIDGRNVEDGSELLTWFEWLRLSRDPRIKYVIYENRMFSSYPSGGVPAWAWRPYHGKNGHRHHGHISILSTVAAEQDIRSWFPANAAGGPDPQSEEDDMPYTPEQLIQFGRVAVARELADPESAGHKAMRSIVADVIADEGRQVVAGEAKKAVAFAATGRTNSTFDPSRKGNEWMAEVVDQAARRLAGP